MATQADSDRLAALKVAYDTLLLGRLQASVTFSDGRGITYAKPDMARLSDEIAALQRIVDAIPVTRRRPIMFHG